METSTTNNGQPKKRRRRPTDEQNRVIEQTRHLLTINFTTGDAKRALMAQCDLSRRQAMRYIALARARNREAVGKTDAQAKSDSVGFWARKQQKAEDLIAKETARVTEAHATIFEAQGVLADDSLTEAAHAIATVRLEAANKTLETARRLIAGAEHRSMTCQEHIDNLLGTRAPLKVAATNAAGQDIQPRPVPEPMTMEDVDAEIHALCETLRKRAQLDATPSDN